MPQCRLLGPSKCPLYDRCSTDCSECHWCAAANIHGWGDGKGGWIRMRGGHDFNGDVLHPELIDYGPVPTVPTVEASAVKGTK